MYDFRNPARSSATDDDTSLTIKLNDMIEVIGVLNSYQDLNSKSQISGDHSAAEIPTISGDPFFGFEQADATPQKLKNVPTVHCIIFRKLCSAYPLLRSVGRSPDGGSMVHEIMPHGNSFIGADSDNTLPPLTHVDCHNAVVKLFSDALDGDETSAAYLSLALVSSVTNRERGEVALGSMPLNIHGIHPDDRRINKLVSAIQRVVPRVVQV